jgi:sugar O-acyltransferase (sialic acid O-acetyltransferase NeuD family)
MGVDLGDAEPRPCLDFRVGDRIVVWGAGGHARVAAEIVRLRGATITGFIDDVNGSRRGELFCGAHVLGPDDLVRLRDAGTVYGMVAVGDGAARRELTERLTSAGLTLATAVHPNAVVAADSVLEPGTLVAAGAVVVTGATVGRGCIINTCASVDHDCTVDDWVHICPGAHVAGRVNIGKRVWVGAGATINDHVTIGEGSVIGAGAVVLSPIPAGVVAYGVPARVIRPT